MGTLNSTVAKANLNYAGAGTGASLTRHHASYTDRTIRWFQGVDNLLDLTISGSDRRPLSLLHKEVMLILWDNYTSTTIFKRRAIPTVAENGEARLTIYARDLMTSPPGRYMLSATLVDGRGLETALTWDRSQRAHWDVEIMEAVVPIGRSTFEITEWPQAVTGTDSFASSSTNGPSYYRKDTSLFSSAVYASNFTGTVILQGTLDDVITEDTLWADLVPQDSNTPIITYTGFTGIDPFNYYAGVRWLRTIITTDVTNAGTLDKILIRV